MISEDLRQAIVDLLSAAGLGGDFSLHPIVGGANNRVFRVDVDDSCALLKAYFRHANDLRDRLGSEFAFSTFAWHVGVRSLPRPLACDTQRRLALYEFVHGRQLLPHEVTEAMVREALSFYRELNRHKGLPAARALPKASEACFTIADHLECVERRLENLRSVADSSELNREAVRFIRKDLTEAWAGVTGSVRQQAGQLGLALHDETAQQDRCVSPSDFGFHNAILAADGKLRFIDFEYAGWDDPVKMVCDFFCQPALPVPLDYYDMFVETVVSDLSVPERFCQQMALLLPVYRMKWCCILVNEFLPVGRERRRFADKAANQDEHKARQLQKARVALRQIQ